MAAVRHRRMVRKMSSADGEIRARVFDDAAERLEGGALRVEHAAHARVEWQAAEIRGPGDAQTAQVARQIAVNDGGIGALAARIARVGTSHDAEQERDVGDRPCHRAVDAEAEPRKRVGGGGHETDRRPQRHDVVEVGGVAQRAAEIAAVGDGQHASRQRRSGAAARAAGALAQVVGIAGRAVHLVVGVRAEPELGDVGLADCERSGATHALDEHRIRPRDMAGIDPRAARTHQPLGVLQVLERDGQPVQRADRVARRLTCVRLVGERQAGLVGKLGHDGVHGRVDPRDLRQVGGHDLARRDLAARDQASQRSGARETEGRNHGHAE